jgi:ABC-type amino acid transport system permease subunit
LWCSGIFRENVVIFRVIPPYSVIFRHIPWYSAIFRDIPAFRVFTTPVLFCVFCKSIHWRIENSSLTRYRQL